MRNLSPCDTAPCGGSSRRQAGFTLLELSAVIFIITVLVSLLCAALNHTKAKAQRISCLDSLKQLQLAWIMYTAEDDEGALPLNQTAPAPNHHRIIPRRTSTNSWVVGNPVEDLTTANLVRGTLYPYVRSTAVYRCPMDTSTVAGHPDVLRTRSYSMNAFLGGDLANGGTRVKYRYNELNRPENIFVFIEEHEMSLWGSSFFVMPRDRLSVASSSWISTPSDRHNQGANISFADGHVEYWPWYAPKQSNLSNRLTSNGRELSDIRRLQACVPAP